MAFAVGLLMVKLLSVHALQIATIDEFEGKSEYFKQPMRNIEDVSYVATIKVGGQEMEAVLDTGSYDVEVFSQRCGESCHGAGSKHYYDRNASKTYEAGDLLQLTSYESGDVLAQSGTDKIEFGPLDIKHQPFWEVVYAKLDILAYGDFQAIVGVGPPGADAGEIEAEAKAAEYMKSQFKKLGFKVPKNFSKKRYQTEVPKMKTVLEKLNTRTFSVCLGRKAGSKGYFVWNDHSPANNPDFREVEVAGKLTWGVSLSEVAMKNDGAKKGFDLSCRSTSCAAIVDSGTSLIMVPTNVYEDLFNHLKKLEASCDHMDLLPPLVFKLAGQKYELPPQRYMGFVDETSLSRPASEFFPFLDNSSMQLFHKKGSQSCVLSIGKIDVTTQLGPMWIMGMPFFREYYTTFELGEDLRNTSGRKMYLANADHNCEPKSGAGLTIKQNSNIPLSLKSKHLRVPRWAVKAHRAGSLDI